LPIHVYNIIVSTLKLPGPLQVSFQHNLLHPLITGSASQHLRYEPTQEHFENKLLLLRGPSQSVIANARIALIVEQLFSHMVGQDALKSTIALRKAVESGIELRHSALQTEKRSKKNAQEIVQSKALMMASSERMLALLEVLEISSGSNPQPWDSDARDPRSLSFVSGSPLSSAPESDMEEDD
jgi:hypothetical protein